MASSIARWLVDLLATWLPGSFIVWQDTWLQSGWLSGWLDIRLALAGSGSYTQLMLAPVDCVLIVGVAVFLQDIQSHDPLQSLDPM